MGRSQFAKDVVNIPDQAIAVQESPSPARESSSSSDSLAVDNAEIVEIYAPSGSVYTVQALFAQFIGDSDATSGELHMSINTQNIETMFGVGDYNTRVEWSRGHWTGGKSFNPDDDAAAQLQLQRLRASENDPLVFKFYNRTDAPHANTRKIDLALKESKY